MLDLIGTCEKPLAVVTGAAGGIGRAVARRLGARYRLVLADVAADPVGALRDALVEEGYDVAIAAVADIGSRHSVDDLAAEVARTGTLGTVVHTAGLSPALADWQRIVEVNLTGTAHVLDAFLQLAVPGSSVVCLASVAAYTFPASPEADALLDDPYQPDLTARLEPLLRRLDVDGTEFSFAVKAYGASKRGVIRLVERRAGDWARRGARIVSISPGTVLTPMGRAEHEANPLAAAAANVTPLRRRGMPADIAAAADFLTSDLAGYITGADLRVDGGIVAARTHGAGTTN
jgi:NAD(P)-dependent dehydrogenase (short-subunit alcohol dehydrogenase family)